MESVETLANVLIRRVILANVCRWRRRYLPQCGEEEIEDADAEWHVLPLSGAGPVRSHRLANSFPQ